jgi:magnesium chelatase family protein
MYSKVLCFGLWGIDGYLVEVETHIRKAAPGFEIVGLGDTAVKESRERVRAAIKQSGYEFPRGKTLINLAPADLKKEGTAYDLPVATGILKAQCKIHNNLENIAFAGELALDGSLKSTKGILTMALTAVEKGIETFVVPMENIKEASIVKSLNVIGVSSLRDIIDILNGVKEYNPENTEQIEKDCNKELCMDFIDVKGQEIAKRAIEICASGSHNSILIGAPGCGKTMLAKRIPSILPEMTVQEAIDVTKIHSIAGTLGNNESLVKARPFRSPHHSASLNSIIGGGKMPKPGEISLANHGILFLDEILEFRTDALEGLRQPLEDGTVTITRVQGSMKYPCNVTLIATANPCKCGFLMDKEKECTCSAREISNYQNRLSGPLLDRIDMHIEVPSVKYKEIVNKYSGDNSETIKKRVEKTRKIQNERYASYNIYTNAQLPSSLVKKFCKPDKEGSRLLENAFEKLNLSMRAYTKILKISRTIADMEESEKIQAMHIAEAIKYRSLDMRDYR